MLVKTLERATLNLHGKVISIINLGLLRFSGLETKRWSWDSLDVQRQDGGYIRQRMLNMELLGSR